MGTLIDKHHVDPKTIRIYPVYVKLEVWHDKSTGRYWFQEFYNGQLVDYTNDGIELHAEGSEAYQYLAFRKRDSFELVAVID